MSLEVEHAGRLEASSLEIGWLYLLLAPTLLVSGESILHIARRCLNFATSSALAEALAPL